MSRIAMILADDYEDPEFERPFAELTDRGHRVDVLGLQADAAVVGKRGGRKTIDGRVESSASGNYDALVIPGGYSPDHLRTDREAVAFTAAIAHDGKPVAAICHAPWMLIEAGVVEGRTLTSWPSLATDLRNAGATWVDRELVVEDNLITSRRPDDLPAFTAAILRAIGDHGVADSPGDPFLDVDALRHQGA